MIGKQTKPPLDHQSRGRTKWGQAVSLVRLRDLATWGRVSSQPFLVFLSYKKKWRGKLLSRKIGMKIMRDEIMRKKSVMKEMAMMITMMTVTTMITVMEMRMRMKDRYMNLLNLKKWKKVSQSLVSISKLPMMRDLVT